MLDEVKESIINAFMKSKRAVEGAGLTLMDAEKRERPPTAVELGFADDPCLPRKKIPPRTGELCVLAASGDKPAAEQAFHAKTEQKQLVEPLYQRLPVEILR